MAPEVQYEKAKSFDCPVLQMAKYMLIGTVTIPTKKGRPKLVARDPEKDQQLDLTEEALMSLYDQYEEMGGLGGWVGGVITLCWFAFL